MPSLFAHMTDEELDNHPAIQFTAEFLVQALREEAERKRISPATDAEATAPPQHPQPRRRKTALQRRAT